MLEALQGAGNKPGDTEVRVSNIMNHLGKEVPETARQLYNVDQVPQNDITGGDFVIAKLQGGKDFKGLEEVKLEATHTTYKIGQIIGNVETENFFNINTMDNFHLGDVIHKN